MSITHMERKLLIFYNTMNEDAKIWFMAKAVELSEEFPTAELREAIMSRHQMMRSDHH
jgi:hypothetical protein